MYHCHRSRRCIATLIQEFIGKHRRDVAVIPLSSNEAVGNWHFELFPHWLPGTPMELVQNQRKIFRYPLPSPPQRRSLASTKNKLLIVVKCTNIYRSKRRISEVCPRAAYLEGIRKAPLPRTYPITPYYSLGITLVFGQMACQRSLDQMEIFRPLTSIISSPLLSPSQDSGELRRL